MQLRHLITERADIQLIRRHQRLKNMRDDGDLVAELVLLFAAQINPFPGTRHLGHQQYPRKKLVIHQPHATQRKLGDRERIPRQTLVQLKPCSHMQHLTLKESLKKICLGRTPWVYVYVVLIPLVNWSFANVPNYEVFSGTWNPMVIVTGLVLVVRDFAQREVGHTIFLPLCVGIAFSFVMAPPQIAAASAIAFGLSECIDWLIYSFSKRPLSQRVLLSTVASAPIDSTVFLLGANMAVPGLFSWMTLLLSILSKIAGGYVVYSILKRRERQALAI
jgi:hypothetical protein